MNKSKLASTFIIVSIIFSIFSHNIIFADSKVWIQSDWTGGPGNSTYNQFNSSNNIDFSNLGAIRLDKNEMLTNNNFDDGLYNWSPNSSWWETVELAEPTYLYSSIGADDYADSLVNLANPGLSNLTEEEPPTWDKLTGWTFNGEDQYLIGPEFEENNTILIQFKVDEEGSPQFPYLSGIYTDACSLYAISPYHNLFMWGRTPYAQYLSGGIFLQSYEPLINGHMGLSGPYVYLQGDFVHEITDLKICGSQNTRMFIGAVNDSSEYENTPIYFFQGDIVSVSIFDRILLETEVSAWSNAMDGDQTRATVTNTKQYQNSSSSAKISVQQDKPFVQVVELENKDIYNLEALVYIEGDPITEADIELFVGDSTIDTTYDQTEKDGWYRISAEVNGINGQADYGVEIKTGRTVYLDEISLWKHHEAGTLISNIYNTGYPSNWGYARYSYTGSGNIEFRIRTSNNESMLGAPQFIDCLPIASGTDISSNSCVKDGDQYVQYQLTLTSGSSPTIQEVRIEYDIQGENAATHETDELAQTGSHLYWAMAIVASILSILLSIRRLQMHR